MSFVASAARSIWARKDGPIGHIKRFQRVDGEEMVATDTALNVT